MSDAHRIQSDLEQAVADREEKAQLVRRLEASEPHLAELDERVAELRRRLDDESADVERLESFSAARIWAKLKGSHEGDLERETAERDAARYAVAEAEARREMLRRDRASLESRVRELWNADVRYQAAMEAKEAWVVESGDAAAAELAEIAERRGRLGALDRETREAFAAGRTAHGLLGEVASLLASAGNWSTWDTFAGGGLVTDLVKYEKIDRATQALRRVDVALQSFSRELADIDMPQVEGVRIEQMTRAFDIWFDNIFSDMAVRSRIEDARRRVDDASRQVHHALEALGRKGRDLQQQLAELDARRERLLVG